VAGFFRAIVGTLDCLGATIVGVAALPTRILTADLASARAAFQSRKLPEAGRAIQMELFTHVENAVERVGPAGWLKWATDFRNMLVHRARRMEVLQSQRRESPILDAVGRSIVRAETTIQLPADPGRSEIEVMFHRPNALVLTEAAQDTLEGVMASTLGFVTEVGGHWSMCGVGVEHLLTFFLSQRSNGLMVRRQRQQDSKDIAQGA